MAPKNSRRERNGDDHRHEDAADTVAEPLDVGAAGLRALDGGDDVGERGRLASGGDAHDKTAIQIHRPCEQFAAGLFVRRNGFAGKHRLVHGGFAFKHNAVHRHTVAGAQRDAVVDFQFGNRNFCFFP